MIKREKVNKKDNEIRTNTRTKQQIIKREIKGNEAKTEEEERNMIKESKKQKKKKDDRMKESKEGRQCNNERKNKSEAIKT